jgi:hypothetical protein
MLKKESLCHGRKRCFQNSFGPSGLLEVRKPTLELKKGMTASFLKESTASTWELVANITNSLLTKIELGCMRNLIHIL